MAVESEQNAHYCATLRRALELYVGRGRPFPVEAISETTGIACQTIYAYKRGEITPSFATVMALMAALPAGFGNMVLAPAGLTGAMKPGDEANGDARILHTSVCGAALALAEALEDGHIDHRERMTLQPILTRLAEDISGYLARDAGPKPVRAAE